MKVATIKQMAFLVILGVMVGCMVYPEQMEQIKSDLAESKPMTYDVYSKTGGNKLLALQESGRLAQLQGNYSEAAEFYGQAITFSDKLEDKALFSIGEVADSTLSVASGNDLSMDYPAQPFDRMMLHVLNSFNCLALGDVDGFGVDMRHLERLMEIAKKSDEATKTSGVDSMTGYEAAMHVKEYQSSQQKRIGLVASSSDFNPNPKTSWDNAYALYLMALYREMRGDFREALSHYEEIRAIGISNHAIDKGVAACKGTSMADDEGEIVAFLEEGFVPGKKVNHTVLNSGLNMTLPNYGLGDCLPYQEGGPLVLFEGRKCLAMSDPLCDLAALAVIAHEERMEGIIGRKTLTSGIATGLIGLNRFINGTIMTNPIHEAVLLFCGLFTCPAAEIAYLCSERPDLRSWALLPRCVQVARFSLKSGRHELLLYSAGKAQKLSVDVKPATKTIIHCIVVPSSMKCSSAILEK